MFLEYSGNITLWLPELAKRSIFVITKSYTFNTKTTFPSRTLYNIFFFKMFPKSSLDVPNIVTLREHSANIPRISRADWVLLQIWKLFVVRQFKFWTFWKCNYWILQSIQTKKPGKKWNELQKSWQAFLHRFDSH